MEKRIDTVHIQDTDQVYIYEWDKIVDMATVDALEIMALKELVDLTQEGGLVTQWWDTTNDPYSNYKDPNILAKLGGDAHLIVDSEQVGKEIRFILKGGKGSGFTSEAGHAGIIGMRGGSTQAGLGGLNSFEKEHFGDSVEWAACFDKDGHLLYTASGRAGGLEIPWETAAKMGGGTFSHTHNQYMPFSIEDVTFADHMALRELRATAKDDNGRQVVYAMKPKSGNNWPNEESFKINLNGVRDELKHYGLDTSQGEGSNVKARRDYWNKFWQSFSSRMGLEYTETTL